MIVTSVPCVFGQTALHEELADSPYRPLPFIISRDPSFTVPLAGHARFQAVLARLEAETEALKRRWLSGDDTQAPSSA
jgi:hypothetical protein